MPLNEIAARAAARNVNERSVSDGNSTVAALVLVLVLLQEPVREQVSAPA